MMTITNKVIIVFDRRLLKYLMAVIFTPNFPNRDTYIGRLYFMCIMDITMTLSTNSVIMAYFAVIIPSVRSIATVA